MPSHRVVLAVALGLAWMLPAQASAVGELSQKSGLAACISNDNAGGQCTDGNLIGYNDFVISPDGENAYATSWEPQNSVTIFDRDPTTGALTQKDGAQGCISHNATPPCVGAPIEKANGIAISPDGATVYVSSFDDITITVWQRDLDTGVLTQLAGDEGCWASTDQGGTCQVTHGMGRPDRMAISPNGLNLYVTSDQGSVAVFDRDDADGTIEQLAGQDGCVSDDGSSGACVNGRALGHAEGLKLSPDGANLYVTSRFDSAIVVFDRDLGTGVLTQKAGTAGCIQETVDDGCEDGVGLAQVGNRQLKNPAVTATNVYVPSNNAGTTNAGGVAIFDRAPDGTLTQKPGTAACVSNDGSGGVCVDGHNLFETFEVTLSPDGRTAYTAGSQGAAIFDRDTTTGELTQKANPNGCVTDTGDGSTCVDAFSNGGFGGVPRISPNGLNAYFSMGTNATNAGIAVFDRVPVPAPPPPPPGGGGGGGGGVLPTADTDLDTIPDTVDNCAAVPNRDQRNTDGDAQGDACDIDDDNDGRLDATDACPTQYFLTSDGCPPLKLDGNTPDVGGPGDVTVTITGTGLTGNPQVRLVSGDTAINAKVVDTSPGGRALDVRFDLAGRTSGWYDVVVSRGAGGGTGTLKKALYIARRGGPTVTSELVGRNGALGNYPSNVILRATNHGSVDAVNAVVRVDGWESGAHVEIRGGATGVQLDNGTRHSVAVRFDRIPADGSATAFLRFTPIGDAHAVYRFTTRTFADTLPAASVKAGDPSAGVTRTGTPQNGSFTVRSNAGTAALQYALTFREGGSGGEPKIERSGSGYTFRAGIPAKGEGPPNGRPRPISGVLELKLVGSDQDFNRLLSVRDGTGNNAVIAHRKYIADCLLARTYINKDQHGDLNRLADGGGALAALQLAVLQKELQELLSGRFETFAARFGDEWEIALMAYLEAAAKRDPTNPFFKGKTPEQMNGAVLEVCRREERENPPPPPPPPGKEEEPKPKKEDPKPRPPDPPPFPIEVFYPADPNDKAGPSGYGRGHHIPAGQRMPYAIFFENKPDATAPAHEVRITDQLDTSKLDLATLQLGPVFWGNDRIATPPAGVQEWQEFVDLRPAKNLVVRIDAGLNRTTGVLSWHLQGLDPATGELDVIPENGFLPPDKAPPEGQGGVTFTVSPKPGLRTGTKIANGASIVFDRNAPILTPTFVNTIDDTAPTSRIASLRARKGSCRDLRATFAGSDRGAGIAYRTVSVSRNGARYRTWLPRERARRGTYRALREGAYAFRSVATDGVGHAEVSSGLWDDIVTRVRKRGNRLVLSLSRRNARSLGVTSLRVTVDGKRKATLKRMRSSVTLRGVKNGGHTIGLRAGKLRDSRAVAMCAKAKRRR